MPQTGRLISRKIGAARLVMTMERAAEALFWPLMTAGVAAFFLLTGMVASLAPLGRAGFWLVAFGGMAVGLWNARHFRLPDAAAAVARLERESGLSFHPLTALRDRLAVGEPSLWAAHQARMGLEISRVRLARPHIDFAKRDPFALRNALMLLLVVAFVLRGGPGGFGVGWGGMLLDACGQAHQSSDGAMLLLRPVLRLILPWRFEIAA